MWNARAGTVRERVCLGDWRASLHAAVGSRGRGEEAIPNGGFRGQSFCSTYGLHYSGDNYRYYRVRELAIQCVAQKHLKMVRIAWLINLAYWQNMN